METSEAIRRLKEELGFHEYVPDQRVAAGAKRVLDASFIRTQRDAILECLEVVNRAANGQVPSQNIGPRPDAQVIVETQYWIAEVVSGGLHTLTELSSSDSRDLLLQGTLLAAITSIADAWSHVLAGDIDDLAKEQEWSRT